MTKKKITPTARRHPRASVMLEIELPELSDEAASAMADVLAAAEDEAGHAGEPPIAEVVDPREGRVGTGDDVLAVGIVEMAVGIGGGHRVFRVHGEGSHSVTGSN